MRFLFLIVFISSARLISAQNNFSGHWQGIIIREGQKIDQGTPISFNFTITNGILEGKSRDEIMDSDLFAVKKLKGTAKDKTLTFKQIVVEKKKSNSKSNWCLVEGQLSYNDSTGYLTGKYTSTDCRNNIGKIILYKSKLPFGDNEKNAPSQIWFSNFLKDYKKGYNSPEIRELERKNFVFQAIYFDYDKFEIRPEYHDFLKKMIRVVDGHTDLRIKVTGNTDSDGSSAYNLELSKKRAQALIDYFVANGLSKDRIEIDFKGEDNPIDINTTEEGKQKNRRVEFAFI